jgi:hypothetical protein
MSYVHAPKEAQRDVRSEVWGAALREAILPHALPEPRTQATVGQSWWRCHEPACGPL